ncbi:MAG: L,D-transpeptidase [Solirubrobacteraceae bacterium]|nr:L,D-transpeptidase [Solirubrobacteraceae bacterium]
MNHSPSLVRGARLALLPAVAFSLTLGGVAEAAAPHNPAPDAPVRIERIHGSNALVVAAPKATVGLRVNIPAPADGSTEAEVRISRDGRVTHRRTVKFTIKNGQASLKASVKTHSVGTYRVGVRVAGRVVGDVVEFDAIPRRVTSGSPKRSIRMAQAILARRAYVTGKPGQLDGRTQRAFTAARKRLGLSRTATYDSALASRLARGEGAWKVRFPSHGRHVEADISLQLLALIGEGGKVERIYTTSTGAPATPTIKGSFSVYRKDLGTNAKGMVHSSYFIRGYAIHGYKSVPTYNASHGCLRVPVPDAMNIFKWVRYGTKVDVYA